MISVAELLSKIENFRGEIIAAEDELKPYSRDASIFEMMPAAVVVPKDAKDIATLVSFVAKHKKDYPHLSLTGRAAGTDMSGGPLTQSVVVDMKNLNHFRSIKPEEMEATAEPGMFYRDFDRETKKKGLIMPSYPASRELCKLGGIVMNNSAGEKSLRYGKTNKYIKKLRVVLADGNEYEFGPLNREELEEKKKQDNFEGHVYREMHRLITENAEVIERARPKVLKNSAGYALWDVDNGREFDLTQLFCGSQGTLGLYTRVTFKLVKPKPHRRLIAVFFKSLDALPDVVNTLLPFGLEGLESFDDNTMKLGMKFFPAIAKKIEGQSTLGLALQFIPEAIMGAKMMRFPKLIVLVQVAENSADEADKKARQLKAVLNAFPVQSRIIWTEKEAEKYWVIRRESFNLLRQRVKGKKTAPFVDDFIVQPKHLPVVLPKVMQIMKDHGIHATIAGHAGEGNFHIIPLMDISKSSEREKIPVVADKVYELVLKHEGSITAEHNDGLIRSQYLKRQFGPKVYSLFEEVKKIFDPDGIFNPHKKVGVTQEFSMKHMQTTLG